MDPKQVTKLSDTTRERNNMIVLGLGFVGIIIYIIIIVCTKKKINRTLDPIVNIRVNKITLGLYRLILMHALVNIIGILGTTTLMSIMLNRHCDNCPSDDKVCKRVAIANYIIIVIAFCLIKLVELCIVFELAIVFLITRREKNMTLPELYYIA